MVYLQKSQPAPPCLAIEKAKANGSYNCDGVLNTLRVDFKNKCYLCEDKEPVTINTEHFRPHRNNNKELKFSWENLFYCCGHCNNTKSDNVAFDDILDCTIEADGVDTKIQYYIRPFPKESAVFTPRENNQKVSNTIRLLNEVYNGTTELKKIESANLRSKLLRELKEFQELLFEYYDDTLAAPEIAEIKAKIIRRLNPASNFTAFKKWVIRDNAVLLDEFNAYL